MTDYSTLYQQANNLHPGSSLDKIRAVIAQARSIAEYDRVRLFRLVANNTTSTLEAVEALFATTPDLASPKYETHAQVLDVLEGLVQSATDRSVRSRLTGILLFLTEQERLAEEATSAAIEEISKADPTDGAEDLLRDLVAAVDLLPKMFLREQAPDLTRTWLKEIAEPVMVEARAFISSE